MLPGMGSTRPIDDWDPIAPWWRREVADDPVYTDQILPMLESLLPAPEGVVVDLGCGEGQGMRRVVERGGHPVGCDLSRALLGVARTAGPVVRCRLPDLGWLRDGVVDVAYSVYVLDLLGDAAGFFADTARVVRPGGALVVIINHPAYTPHAAGPIIDVDGEVLWRWGAYLQSGTSLQPAGGDTVIFHHRSMSSLLTTAAAAGWSLVEMREEGLGAAAIAREPGYRGQEGIPRVLGLCWRRLP